MLNIGSVGTSSIMLVIQEAISLTEGLTCKVIFSRDRDRAKAFAEKTGVAEICDDYDSLISREDLDIIYIASPNVCHRQQVLKALNHGKHVIVEKPAGIAEAEVEEMYAAAKANHVFFFEAITTLFMPNYLAFKEMTGKIGTIRRADFRFGRYSSKYDEYLAGKNPNIFNPDMKAGALNDMGIYCIHAVLDLFGRPEGVRYEPVLGPNGIDLSGVLTLDYPDMECRIETAKDHNIDCRCKVEGSEGWTESEGLINEPGICTAQIGGEYLKTDFRRGENRMIFEQSKFRDAILQKDTAFFEQMYQQSKAAAYILEAAHKSYIV